MRKRLFLCGLLILASCGQGWRASAVAKAEAQIRREIGDPAARFSRTQLTGDSSAGQTCGYVMAKVAGGAPTTGRFIDYIDQTAGPFIEHGMGQHFLSQDRFDEDWQADCVKEGYRS